MPSAPASMARASLTPHETHVVQMVILSVSTVSLAGCFYILLHQYRVFRDNQKVSMTHRMVLVLAILDFMYTATKMFGRKPIDHRVGCQIQGFMITSAGTMIFCWTSAMAHSMYRWIVCRDSQTKLENRFKWYLLCSIVPCASLGLAFVVADLIGDATFYCWVSDPDYYPLALVSWLICAMVYVCALLCITQSHLTKRAQTQENADALESLSMVSFKLRTYMVAFVLLWLPSLVFRCFEMFGQPPTFTLALIMQATLSLQGLVNAVTYGGLLTAWWKAIQGARNKANKSTDNYKTLLSPSFFRTSDFDFNSSQERIFHDSARIFVSTFNLGQSRLSSTALAQWIPRGYDIYVIGVQECLQLSDLRSKILRHIQSGPKEKHGLTSRYNQFTREIGNRNTALGFHGHIAITVYVKSEDVDSGAFFMPTTAQQEVNRGISLVLGRASNKGAVGFAFRYYNTSLAFVACHLTSDCKGKSKASRRNQDLTAILEQLNLNVDDVGCEFPLIHHHTFILGDLNYRLALGNPSKTPQEVLQLITDVSHDETLCVPMGVDRVETTSAVSAPQSDNDSSGPCRPDNESVLVAREKQRIWSKLLVHDELTYYLRSGQVLYGFEEPEISFPPTFRRIRGTHLPSDAASSWNLEQVTQCFSTEVEGAGQRVPSYTDRILFRSLSDCRDRLRCVSYSSCEQVDVSDHKPVNGVFELVVDRCCKPLELYRQSVAYVQRVKDLAGVYDCCICLQYGSLVWVPKTGDEVHVHKTERNTGTSKSSFVCPDGKLLDAKLVNVSVVFPLPSEDIFSEQRKLHEMADTVTDGMFPNKSHPNQALKNVTTTTSWNEFHRKGMRHTSLTYPDLSRHIAIKVHTASNKCLGQGVLGFCHDVEGPQSFEIGLSVGGSLVGRMSGVVSIGLTRSRCCRL